MLEKAGSKLYLAGEYAILSENSYAIVSFIPKYTYLNIEENDIWKIVSEIEDKDNIIGRVLSYLEKNFEIKKRGKLKYYSELYKNNKKYGLGSSASLIVVTIKAILKMNDYIISEKHLFDIAIDFMIENDISGSFGDIACICYESNILFKSSNRIDRKYIIEKINVKTNLKVEAIWTTCPSSSSKLISKIDMNNSEFEKFKNISNILTLGIFEDFKENKVDEILEKIDKLNENLHFLEKNNDIVIHTPLINEFLNKYKHSKISGAGGGDFILSFSKSDILEDLKVFVHC
ncbi:hypothetical protein CEP89_06220 [Streptobacillus moniliformis]|uniref:GHMP kinase n=1 Tax=Streptobacillus moniliformis (strain ATCC 14647 / DSM 12112 / NCTC 10651 / 9901) TaxID=519441 RepID=D1AV23_STRM9|nr:GHMP kinase [Streptobacillus moniliformis]ACZ01583.1 GHMP kinase [Streptobacillus moniliformis DSM 12112]AVL43422.1 hypothetical protein CEP89_06220 [Streptobacillus moniliformis]SQA13249.1 mevalonate kinase [Streptobacillus moniliformis]